MGTGRQTQLQVVHKVDHTFNFNDPGIASGVELAWLPAGAVVLRATLYVETAFNAATTNTVSLGYSQGGTDLFNAQSVAATGVDSAAINITNAIADLAIADVPLYLEYSQTVAAATAGVGRVVVEYSPANG